MSRASSTLFVIMPAALLALVSACSSDTVIFLTIDSDFRVPDEMNAVRVEVETREKSLMNQSYPIESQDDLPATLTITALNDKEAEVHIIVTGLKGAAEVGWGDAWATFIKGETVDVSVVVTKRPPPGEDGGHDSGVEADSGRDGGRDAGSDAEVDDVNDAATDAGIDGLADTGPDVGQDTGPEPVDDSGPDAGIPDVPTEDTGTDAGPESDDDAYDGGPADVQVADVYGDAGWDSGYWIGGRCAPDAGCGQNMFCLDYSKEQTHGMCSTDCSDAGCPEGSSCMDAQALDAGALCVKTCTRHTDCERSDMGCYDISGSGTICALNVRQGPDGSRVIEYPFVEVSPETINPAVGESVQLAAKYLDEDHQEVPGVDFTWYSSDSNVAAVSTTGVVDAVAFGKARVSAAGNGTEGQSEVSVEAVVTTLAGDGTEAFVDGKGAAARFVNPEFLVVKGTEIYVSDFDPTVFRPAVRKILADGTVTTWSKAQLGCADGDLFTSGYEIAGLTNQNGSSDFYFSDPACNAIRKFTPAGVTTIFSSTKGFADGDKTTAKIDGPAAIKATDDGLLFFDTNNHRIRLIPYDGSSITTVAGSGASTATDGPALQAGIENVGGITTNGPTTTFYFTEYDRHLVKQVAAAQVTTYAGTGIRGDRDGIALAADFDHPKLLISLQGGGLAISATKIRFIDDNVAVSTAACRSSGYLQDGKFSDCALNFPVGIAFLPPFSYVLADMSNKAVRLLKTHR